jgi:hypothetical protein
LIVKISFLFKAFYEQNAYKKHSKKNIKIAQTCLKTPKQFIFYGKIWAYSRCSLRGMEATTYAGLEF